MTATRYRERLHDGPAIAAAVSLREALDDPQLLGDALRGDSWAQWRPLLIACMGERLTPTELTLFQQVTGRSHAPAQRCEEAWFIIGRRGGKDKAASTLAVYLSSLVDWSRVLTRGERGLVVVIGGDREQARIQRDYIEGTFDSSPLLARLVKSRGVDSITLSNGITISVRAANFRRLRGPTCVAVIATETATWFSEDSSNPDTEILHAVRPTLATTGGPLIVISSPYARRGELWATFRKNYGADGDPRILVAQGASRDFNPTLPQSVIDRAMERDPHAARAEYLAEFRTDIESFVAREIVEQCIDPGVFERAPQPDISYRAFVDPSGGSSDSMTLCVGHLRNDIAVVDAIRETKPPFSPESVVADFAALLKSYRISRVSGDRYAGEWPREQFRRHGIDYEPAARTKSDLYRDTLPLLNSGKVALLDHGRCIGQLVSLERRTARGGKDSIDHPKGAHDDCANAVAGVVVGLALDDVGYVEDMSWVGAPTMHPDQLARWRHMNYWARYGVY
jgi:hypothetical protein